MRRSRAFDGKRKARERWLRKVRWREVGYLEWLFGGCRFVNARLDPGRGWAGEYEVHIGVDAHSCRELDGNHGIPSSKVAGVYGVATVNQAGCLVLQRPYSCGIDARRDPRLNPRLEWPPNQGFTSASYPTPLGKHGQG